MEWSAHTGLVDKNGDAEMWLRLCSLNNRPLVRVPVVPGAGWTSTTRASDLTIYRRVCTLRAVRMARIVRREPGPRRARQRRPRRDHRTCSRSASPSRSIRKARVCHRGAGGRNGERPCHPVLSGRLRHAGAQAGHRQRGFAGRLRRWAEVGRAWRNQRRAGSVPVPGRDREGSGRSASRCTRSATCWRRGPSETCAGPRGRWRWPFFQRPRPCWCCGSAIPSRLEGAPGGLTGLVAWLGDQQPLLVGVVLFVALSEAARHWTSRVWPHAFAAPEPAMVRSATSRRRLTVRLAAVALVAFFVRGSVVASFRVVGPSMLPTFENRRPGAGRQAGVRFRASLLAFAPGGAPSEARRPGRLPRQRADRRKRPQFGRQARDRPARRRGRICERQPAGQRLARADVRRRAVRESGRPLDRARHASPSSTWAIRPT